ncbi:hypothetical protein [Peribacillus simplex]|nr:hypothetical protein [Peribacillus simplex]
MAVYKITPQAKPIILDSVLEESGYALEGKTSVQVEYTCFLLVRKNGI